MKKIKVIFLAAAYLFLSSCTKDIIDKSNHEPITIEKAKELFYKWKVKRAPSNNLELKLNFRTDSVLNIEYNKFVK